MSDLIQIAAAAAILWAFAWSQLGRLDVRSFLYLWANLLGASILAIQAYAGNQWGFLLLEGVWAAIAATGVARRVWHDRRRLAD